MSPFADLMTAVTTLATKGTLASRGLRGGLYFPNDSIGIAV